MYPRQCGTHVLWDLSSSDLSSQIPTNHPISWKHRKIYNNSKIQVLARCALRNRFLRFIFHSTFSSSLKLSLFGHFVDAFPLKNEAKANNSNKTNHSNDRSFNAKSITWKNKNFYRLAFFSNPAAVSEWPVSTVHTPHSLQFTSFPTKNPVWECESHCTTDRFVHICNV